MGQYRAASSFPQWSRMASAVDLPWRALSPGRPPSSAWKTIACLALLLWTACASAQEWLDYERLMDGKARPDDVVAMLSHSELISPVSMVYREAPVRRLLPAPRPLGNVTFQSGGRDYDLADYLATNRIAGLLVLKDGKVAFEDYELGIRPETRWTSFSVAKSVTSTLLAAALKQGLIGSLDDPVTKYVPELKGGAYDEVSIRNVLQMASGVKWDETYTDPKSDWRHMAHLRVERKRGAILAYMRQLQRAAAPGTVWNYNTGETFIAGAVVEGATHMPLAEFLTRTLWSRLGMEQDATWWIEAPGGMGFGGSGLGITLRDYGRFGQFVLEDGVIDGERIVPEGWFREAGSVHTVGGKQVTYGYQWWTMTSTDPVHQGAFEAAGIFGQHIYVNPAARVVVVILSARPKPGRRFRELDDDAFLAAVVRALE